MQQQIFRQFQEVTWDLTDFILGIHLDSLAGPLVVHRLSDFLDAFLKLTFILTIINNSPSYNCVLGCQAFEQEWG